MRGTFVMRRGRLVRKEKAAPLRTGPMIISDDMPPAEHVDGKFYDSKSSYRRVTKERGLIEVGNDPARFNRPKLPDRDKAIDASIERAMSRAKG